MPRLPEPERFAHRPSAERVVRRLDALRAAVGSMPAMFALVGTEDDFRRLVTSPRNIEAYISTRKTLPRGDTITKLRAFLDVVEPQIASGTPVFPPFVRAQLERSLEAQPELDR